MAYPDRSIGPGEQPDKFTSLVNGLFSEPQMSRFSTELSGFRGRFASEIADWRTKGLGRVIAAPLVIEPTDTINNTVRYRSMFYALPYTDESTTGFDKRVLLVFPSDNKVEFLLVKPYEPPPDELSWDDEDNKKVLSMFSELFTPHIEPSIVEDWYPDPTISQSQAFANDGHYFPVDFVTDHGLAPGELYNNALTNARQLKEKRDARERAFRDRVEEALLDDREGVAQEPQGRQESADKKTGIQGIAIGGQGDPVIFKYYEVKTVRQPKDKDAADKDKSKFSVPSAKTFDVDLVTFVEDPESEFGVREDRVNLKEGVSSMGTDSLLKRAKDYDLTRATQVNNLEKDFEALAYRESVQDQEVEEKKEAAPPTQETRKFDRTRHPRLGRHQQRIIRDRAKDRGIQENDKLLGNESPDI